jgi:hypothetical protein
VECGIKSDELSKPHGANSFIPNFIRQLADELAVLQQRETVGLHLHFVTNWALFFFINFH